MPRAENERAPEPKPRRPSHPSRWRLLVLVHDLVIRLDHVVLLGAGGALRARRAVAAGAVGARLLGALLLVEALARLAEDAGELLLRRADLAHVVAAERLARPLDGRVDLRLRVGRDLVAPLLHVLLDLVG